MTPDQEALLVGLVITTAIVLAARRALRHVHRRWPAWISGPAAVIFGLGLLAVGVYLYLLLDAHANPWILWRRDWLLDSGAAEQKMLGRYTTQNECLKAQWKKLEEELDLKKQAQEVLGKIKLFGKRVHLVEGRTIFEFGPSLLSRVIPLPQANRLMPELRLPEVVSTASFFCAPSLRYSFWPLHSATYYASADDLRRLGEKTLATRAKEMLGE